MKPLAEILGRHAAMVKVKWLRSCRSGQRFIFLELADVFQKGIWIEDKNSRVFNAGVYVFR